MNHLWRLWCASKIYLLLKTAMNIFIVYCTPLCFRVSPFHLQNTSIIRAFTLINHVPNLYNLMISWYSQVFGCILRKKIRHIWRNNIQKHNKSGALNTLTCIWVKLHMDTLVGILYGLPILYITNKSWRMHA